MILHYISPLHMLLTSFSKILFLILSSQLHPSLLSGLFTIRLLHYNYVFIFSYIQATCAAHLPIITVLDELYKSLCSLLYNILHFSFLYKDKLFVKVTC